MLVEESSRSQLYGRPAPEFGSLERKGVTWQRGLLLLPTRNLKLRPVKSDYVDSFVFICFGCCFWERERQRRADNAKESTHSYLRHFDVEMEP